MNDNTRRFLTGILARVPEGRVVEVRLFPAIRQGGMESGVAVLAVEPGFDAIPDATAALDAAGPDDELQASDAVEGGTIAGESEVDEEVTLDDMEARIPIATLVEVAFDRERSLAVAHDGPVPVEELPALMGDATASDAERDVPVVLADAPNDEQPESIALGDILALPEPARPVVPEDRGASARLAILCARYRLVLKGPDRGKWDLEIVHQADAPLGTLDRVIAGVVRRSGEDSEPLRLSAAELRAALDAPAWVDGAAA